MKIHELLILESTQTYKFIFAGETDEWDHEGEMNIADLYDGDDKLEHKPKPAWSMVTCYELLASEVDAWLADHGYEFDDLILEPYADGYPEIAAVELYADLDSFNIVSQKEIRVEEVNLTTNEDGEMVTAFATSRDNIKIFEPNVYLLYTF
jgi:hypothetical protein